MIPLSITFFDPKILVFLLSTKHIQTWEVECENNPSKNRREFIRYKLQKLYMNGTVSLEIFSRHQVIENSRKYLLLRTDILQKTVVGCPVFIY